MDFQVDFQSIQIYSDLESTRIQLDFRVDVQWNQIQSYLQVDVQLTET